MAILVVDLMHGLEPQTLESISMLKRKRTPFVVALNKVDRCYDWTPTEGASIREALSKQAQNTLDEFEQKKVNAFTELNEQSLNVALYWDNEDPGSTVSVVPTSAITGEGVPDLLRVVLSLTQQRLAAKLMFGYNLQCTVLEVKVVEGLGATLDVILVNGCLHAGDTMVLCTQDGPIVTTARALLTPPPSRETRVKSELIKHESLEGAIGLKITGDPELTKVVPGTGILVMHQDDDVEDLKEECMKDIANLSDTLATEAKGVTVQASTLGALEALLEFLRNPGKDRQGKERPPIPVSGATVGPIHKKDVIKAAIMAQKGSEEYSCILGFDVAVDPEAQAYADKNSVKIFTADIIYHLEGHFTRHLDEIMERKRNEARDVAVFPSLFKISKNHVFNMKDPIILGGEVVDGILKVGTPLCIPHLGFLDVGVVQSIECNHKDVQTARKGQECAIKIVNHGNPNMTYGRQFDHNHQLFSKVNRASIDALKKYFKDDMQDADWRLVIKLKKVFSVI
jgi:translation initiation factor 5B